MNAEPTSNTKPEKSPLEATALALYYQAAVLIKEGKTDEDVIAELGKLGIPPETAQMMLDRINVSRRNVEKVSGRRNLGAGIVTVLITCSLLFGWFGVQITGIGGVLVLLLLCGGLYLVWRGLLQLTNL